MAIEVTLKGTEVLPLPVEMLTVPAPVAALTATLTGRLIEVAVMVAGPAVIPMLLKPIVAPERFCPEMVTVWLTVPWTRLLGVIELMAGDGMAAAVMLNILETLPVAVVTVTDPAPVAALAATVTGRRIEVAVTVAGPALIPALLNLIVAPVRLVPVMVMIWFVVPWTRLLVSIKPIVGAGRVAVATVKAAPMLIISEPWPGLFVSGVQLEPKVAPPASYWFPYQATFQL